MVAWWTCPQYIKKHKDAKQRREQMDGGSHNQGSLSLARCRQKEVSKHIVSFLFSTLFFLLHEGVPFLTYLCAPFAENQDGRGADHLWALDQEAYQEGAASCDRVDVDEQG